MCGHGTSCSLHSRSPVPGHDSGHMVTCQHAGQHSSTCDQDIIISPPDTSVAVIDNVVTQDQDCDVSHLLSALIYWCQGKPGGCSVDTDHVQSLVTCSDLASVSVSWHYEPDYNNIEIPCPTYVRGHFTKKFSELRYLSLLWYFRYFIFSSSGKHLLPEDTGGWIVVGGKVSVLGLGR